LIVLYIASEDFWLVTATGMFAYTFKRRSVLDRSIEASLPMVTLLNIDN
jgi:hypothetical protein